VYSIIGGKVDGQLVVPAVHVLDEGVPGRDRPQ
jgi:hypothetical protein